MWVSSKESKMLKRIILLPFCCYHVQGYLRSKSEKENDLFTSLKGNVPDLRTICEYLNKCIYVCYSIYWFMLMT